MYYGEFENREGSRAGIVERALTSHQCSPGSICSCSVIDTWVEFVGSQLCSEWFFSRYPGFSLSSKTNQRFHVSYYWVAYGKPVGKWVD